MLSKAENLNFTETCKNNKIIPVAVFNDLDSAVKIAELLLKNSITILEITLRTDIAFKCINEISKKFPELTVGAGSVLSVKAFQDAIDKGALFGVAPAFDPEVVEFAISKKITFIPGIATPSELNRALIAGLKFIKLFPAANLGGPEYIKAITAPFKTKDFYLVPTGGINEENIASYMKTEKVIACGATYIVDGKLIEKGEFEELERRIRKTKELLK
jgi:2-dehydro-3-deoxyphosphogluconate aldolase/(4S)-4-hydroxy-2-oxoglutarate aldolase